ncbi:hypothetical protein [Flavobacterium psychrophilum]|uniref:hypothetical protein n=1 Tax=Flavobacterium psychrophilum TaxID=96345 RepID=UPI000B7C3DCC|nr:hypothetical protein [Flavobacterium psychrophilum]MCB6089451.1 hypothetical protein [Flavobacterium psychrophilum]MCB6232074.1 hypothetical protein [Flavobacterium psychrophilum]SNA80323.1 hypothetical protein FI146_340010 [Flavobacterium psychrophilum]SNB13556.1 hypothetical protein JIP1600_2250007 [Flavobacterium psychrophilum]
MAKQSKITVKHYLEKRLKLRDFTYPVYCYITYKRQTTKFKSFTGVYLSEVEFDIYSKNNSIDVSKIDIENYNKDKKAFDNVNHSIKYLNNTNSLEREIKSIHFILENYIDKEDIFEIESNFIRNLGFFFNDLKTDIIGFYWGFYTGKKYDNRIWHNEKTKDVDILQLKHNDFVNSFNQENSLLDNLQSIKNLTQIDLLDFFDKSILEKWNALKVILDLYSNSNIVDFIIEFNSENLQKESKYIKISTKKIVFEEIFKDYINHINASISNPF